jgi:hypothetical protein
MVVCSQSNILHWQKQKHQIHWIKYLIIWVSKFNVCIKQLIFNTSISHYLKKKHLLKFFRQNNYTEKAKILYFLNLVYFLSLVGLWQNHVIYLPLTGLMSRYTTSFTKRVVNKYGSVCPCYRSFFHGTLHMWARIDEEHNHKEILFTFQTWQNIIQWLTHLLSHGDICWNTNVNI